MPRGVGSGRLQLEGTVAFTVDGPRGSTAGVVRGDGAVLRVATDDPVATWDAVAGAAPGAAALGALADSLSAQGLAVEVTGPAGVLATVGAGAHSALGRVVTGSRHVQPGRPAALRPLVVSQLRSGLQRRRPLLLAVAAAVLLGVRKRVRAH